MANYVKRPPENNKQPAEKQTSEKLDINALANAVVQAIKSDMPSPMYSMGGSNQTDSDTFDDSGTMDSLAEQMITQRDDNEANFDNLGNVKRTKKDREDVNNTIDILSELND